MSDPTATIAARCHGPGRRLLSLLVATFVLSMLAGCGPTRSVEAFCSTVSSEKERILAQFEQRQQSAGGDELASLFADLGASMEALGELRTYFRRLEEVAPAEIQPEMEIIVEETDRQFDAMGDAAGDPLGALGAAMFGGMTTSGQMSTVNEFALDNCGEGL